MPLALPLWPAGGVALEGLAEPEPLFAPELAPLAVPEPVPLALPFWPAGGVAPEGFAAPELLAPLFWPVPACPELADPFCPMPEVLAPLVPEPWLAVPDPWVWPEPVLDPELEAEPLPLPAPPPACAAAQPTQANSIRNMANA